MIWAMPSLTLSGSAPSITTASAWVGGTPVSVSAASSAAFSRAGVRPDITTTAPWRR